MNMRQRLWFNILAVLITIGIVIALFMAITFGMFYRSAMLPTCSEITQSSIYCDPVQYQSQFFFWSIISIVLIIVAIFFTRKKLNMRAKK